jgi:tRNA (cytidine/uridine-2'-O-)-methyltransferase
MHVVLVHPEIAPNTGAIIRLCANTGAELHLVEPLGFVLSDSLLKRGGLDYHEHATMRVHPDVETALATLPGRRFGFSSRGTRRYTDVTFADDDVLVFGAERAGLDEHAMSLVPDDHLLSIPMRPDNRSLNLANAVSIVLYEAWRQHGFDGAAAEGGTATAERLHLDPFDS